MEYIDNNSCSKNPTHFLAATQLIADARREFNLASENWTYPVFAFGDPRDVYYAEVWVDGMDWQHTYWLVERANYDAPKVLPFIRFEKHEEEGRFNPVDSDELFMALLRWRRLRLITEDFITREELYGCDSIKPFLTYKNKRDERELNSVYEHASQSPVEFWINPELMPGM